MFKLNTVFILFIVLMLQNILFAQELKFSTSFLLDEQPLNNVQVTVYDLGKNKLLENINTGKTNKYKISLETGNNYKIYFSHPKIYKMYFEIIANNMPERAIYNNYYYDIVTECIPRNESGLDTSILSQYSLHRIVYDDNKFIDDTTYNNIILAKLFKNENDYSLNELNKSIKIPYNWAGYIFIKSGNNMAPLTKKEIVLYKNNNKIYDTRYSNNIGQFYFNKIFSDSAAYFTVNINEKEAIGKTLVLTDSKKNIILETDIKDIKNNISLSPEIIRSLIDNRFSFYIGGKIFKETDTSASFLTDEPVHLLNQKGDIIQTTKTNIFGAFVFQDIKPDNIYHLAIKKENIKKPYTAVLYSNIDNPICKIDSSYSFDKYTCTFRSDNNKKFDELLMNESILKMNVKGKVYNENTNNPISDLKIYLISENGNLIDSTITDNYGSFIFAFVPYMKYTFKFYDPSNSIVTSSKILLYSSNDQLVKLLYMVKNNPFIFNLLDYEQKRLTEIYTDDPWLDISSIKLKNKALPVISEHLYFETDRYTITNSAQKTLNKVLSVLNQYPSINIIIKAYTDSRADDKYNLQLSQKRANAVKEYLIFKGIDANRIEAQGMGEENILNHCKNGIPCTDDEHAMNRRVEFILVPQKK